jgi:hypothetical protein
MIPVWEFPIERLLRRLPQEAFETMLICAWKRSRRARQ